MPDGLGGPTIRSMGQIGVGGWDQETNIDLVPTGVAA
jgi:hypothetical protein